MDNLNIRLSEHARDVMKRRSVTFDEIAEVIARPKVVSTRADKDSHGRHTAHDGTTVRWYQSGDLTVVVGEKRHGRGGTFVTRTVITVLFKHDGRWTDEDVRKR